MIVLYTILQFDGKQLSFFQSEAESQHANDNMFRTRNRKWGNYSDTIILEDSIVEYVYIE